MLLPAILAATGDAVDPLNLIIEWGSRAVATLAFGVTSLLLHRLSRIEKKTDTLEKAHGEKLEYLNLQRTEHGGKLDTLRADVDGLNRDMLPLDTFERATDDQNRRLEDLKAQSRETAKKVADVDRRLLVGLAKRPTASETAMPAARLPPEEPREETSDPPPEPPPYRPRAPSRNRFGGGGE